MRTCPQLPAPGERAGLFIRPTAVMESLGMNYSHFRLPTLRRSPVRLQLGLPEKLL